jgi:Leucine-rich repeat (LRR) protein
MSGNMIVGSLPVLNMSNLKCLNLSGNKIDQVGALAECRFDSLEKLVLSSNFIDSLPMLRLYRLKTLDISLNRLTDVRVLRDCCLPSLETLSLASNRIVVSVPVLEMPCLKELVLDDNDMPELEFLTELQFIPSIQRISLKANKRLEQLGDSIVFHES